MSRRGGRWGVLAVAGILGGCSTGARIKPAAAPPHQGVASYRPLADDHMAHYQLALGSISSGAAPIDHPAPMYPGAMLAGCPAQIRLKTLLIVGATGKVEEARFEDVPPDEAAFVEAVRAAVLGWRFEPLVIRRWAADAKGNTHTVETEAKPFSLRYEFGFACRAGRAQVSSLPTNQQ